MHALRQSLAGLILAGLVALAPSLGLGQALPYHGDPTAREIVPDLTAVPAIRFLTTADFPPFNYRDEKSELVGFNVDLARAICADLDIGCTVQAWPWDQAAKALGDNQGDALIAGLAVSPDNGALFDFSSIYLMLPGRFVASRTVAADFDATGLAGRAVAVRTGSAHAEFLRRYIPGVRAIEFADEPAALEALAAGKADLYFGDGLRAAFWLNAHPDCCDFAGEPYFRPDLFGEGLSIAIAPGRDTVRQAIDYALSRLKRSGVYDELYLRWFPISFY
jgi:polar amino acid transport system substrate-binding protein